MAQPTDVTQLGQELYNSLSPLAYADAQNNYALLRFTDALVQAAQQAANYGRDKGNEPGWAQLLNPHTAPTETLTWLSQFAGVNLETLNKSFIITQQNLVYNPNFNYTALNAAPLSWENGSTAATLFRVTEAWAGHKALEIETPAMASGIQNWAVAQGVTKLGAKEKLLLIKELEHYSINAKIKISAVTGTMRVFAVANWYNINGELLKTDQSEAFTAVGEFTVSNVFTAPAGAVGLQLAIVSESKAAASKATLFIDNMQLAPSPTNVSLTYGDGDTAGWVWLGTAGNSQSNKQQLQSEAEYIIAQRNRILELPAEQRGTAAAIEAAVKQYLTGNKTVFLKERDGGAYKLTVVTYEGETPNQAQVKAAIEEQLPGGIVLTYAAVPGATYLIMRTKYATYKAIGVEKAFLTYNGFRNNLPGT